MPLLKLKGCQYWYADYYINGKRKRVSTRKVNKHEAAVVLTSLIADRDAGMPEMDGNLLYSDIRGALIQNYREKGNRSLHLRANGVETVNGLKQLDDFFGYKDGDHGGPWVSDITTETGRQFVTARKAEGAGNAVINRSLACLRRMLKIAAEERKIKYVPVIRLLKEPKPRTGTVPQEKFGELLAMLPTHLRPFVCFLYWTGVRGKEASKIEWDHVDLINDIVQLWDTKNDEPRSVPLASEVVSYLVEIEPKTGRVFDTTNLRKEWQKACAAVGLGRLTPNPDPKKKYDPIYRGLNIHDLRRTALTELTRAGVPQFVAMEISGHKDATVFRRYNIVADSDKKAAMQRRETLYLGKLEPRKAGVKRGVKSLK